MTKQSLYILAFKDDDLIKVNCLLVPKTFQSLLRGFTSDVVD
jgi:hypothetical protein